MSRRYATGSRAVWVSLLTVAVLALGSAAAAGKIVRWHGYQVALPRSWSIFDLGRDPATCVRFNRHALYVGVPSVNQRCPAHAAGRTEAILVEPVGARAAAAPLGAGGAIVRGQGSTTSFLVRSAHLRVTATWSRDRSLLARILRRRLTGRSVTANLGRPSRAHARAPNLQRAFQRAAVSGARPASAVYAGLGFDACSAPSTRAMSAWASSAYRAVGVYIGGVNAACAQPNLTSSWVTGEVAAGWHLIPTYVGLQGAGSCSGTCATITPHKASAQGVAAAADAVTQAQALGIPAGNPIYDDMEAYNRSSSNTAAVLAFLSGWTTQLHAEGYVSGVYSSAASGIADLVNVYGTTYVKPDDIWIGDWNNAKTVNDPYVPGGDWSGRRLHQYSGGHNETHGGVTLNIDGDYLGGATANTTGPIPNGTFVEVNGAPAVYRIVGGAPLYVSSWSGFGSVQPVQLITQQQLDSLLPYPVNGTFMTTTTGLSYRVAGGAALEISNWSLFGGPQLSVTIDEWDLLNISNPLARLRSTPATGTLVEGLPSDTYWSFSGGIRTSTLPTPAATQVDDQALAGFPIGSGGSPLPRTTAVAKCVVPRLKHMTLSRARGALRRSSCRLGKVRRPRHWPRHHVLRVFGQSATARSKHRIRYAVNLWLT
jgi:hypothetical protein